VNLAVSAGFTSVVTTLQDAVRRDLRVPLRVFILRKRNAGLGPQRPSIMVAIRLRASGIWPISCKVFEAGAKTPRMGLLVG